MCIHIYIEREVGDSKENLICIYILFFFIRKPFFCLSLNLLNITLKIRLKLLNIFLNIFVFS